MSKSVVDGTNRNSLDCGVSANPRVVMYKNEITDEEYKCVLCGGGEFVVELESLSDNSGCSNKRFNIVRCLNCSHRSIFPYPQPEDIEKFYPAQYYAHVKPRNTPKNQIKSFLKRQSHRGPAGKFSNDNDSGDKPGLWAKLLAEPAYVDDGKLLDVGCGNGEYLFFAQSCGWNVKGVEPDSDAVEAMQAAGLNVVCSTAEHLPFPAEEFNVVRSWHSLEHTYSPLAALSEIERVLKPNGHLLLSVPNYGCFQSRTLGKYWPPLEIPRHLHHFTDKSLNMALEKVGLRKECEYLYSGMPFFDLGWNIKVMRAQGVKPGETMLRVAKSTLREATARVTGKDCRSFLTWWIRKI